MLIKEGCPKTTPCSCFCVVIFLLSHIYYKVKLPLQDFCKYTVHIKVQGSVQLMEWEVPQGV